MNRRLTVGLGLGGLAVAGAAFAASVQADFMDFALTNDLDPAEIGLEASQSVRSITGWHRQFWDRSGPVYSMHHQITGATFDECLTVAASDLDQMVQPVFAGGGSGFYEDVNGEWYQIGGNFVAGTTTDLITTLASGVAIPIPADFGDASELRFLTTGGSHPNNAADYLVTLTYGAYQEQLTVSVEASRTVARAAGAGGSVDASDGVTAGQSSWTSAGFGPIDTTDTEPGCPTADIYGDSVVITNGQAGLLTLDSVTFTYPIELQGPVALTVEADEAAYDALFTYTAGGTSGEVQADALQVASPAYFTRIEWEAGFDDDYGEIFLEFRCGTAAAAGLVTWDSWVAVPAGLSTSTDPTTELGFVDLDGATCEAQYFQVRVETVAPFDVSPTLKSLNVVYDTDADADGVTAEGLFDITAMETTVDAPGVIDCDDNQALVQSTTTYYVDTDEDGDGAGAPLELCVAAAPPMRSLNDDDCDDSLATYNLNDSLTTRLAESPGEGNDYNCDGLVDCYLDQDGDGDANDADTLLAIRPAVGNSVSCDRGDAADGILDSGGSQAARTRASQGSDCNDSDILFFGTATESTGVGIDYNCNGTVDCFVDADGDNFGTTVPTARPITVGGDFDCLADANAAELSTDCDDADGNVNPDEADTTYTGRDQNCDSMMNCYVDGDGDGDGDLNNLISVTVGGPGFAGTCSGAGESPNNLDCDDTDTAYNVNNSTGSRTPEVAGAGIDYDCSGSVDCYPDDDGDGDGVQAAALEIVVPAGSTRSCTRPGTDGAQLAAGSGGGNAPSTSATNTDCNDSDAGVNSFATELVGDAVDEDCDSQLACFIDVDNDGFGITPATAADVVLVGVNTTCAQAPNAAETDGDCEDTVADGSGFNPGLPESDGDLEDNDCNGFVNCFADQDGDGEGSSTLVAVATDLGPRLSSCDVPTSFTASNSLDCNDTVGSGTDYNSTATEVVGDTNDFNCDGRIPCFTDFDDDGFGDNGAPVLVSVGSLGGSGTCAAAGEAVDNTDCDDNAITTFPGAAEPDGSGVDRNCDGAATCFTDSDGDDYGVPTSAAALITGTVTPGETYDCASNGGSVVSTDCNDAVASINPGADGVEVVSAPPQVDLDCDGQVLCFVDSDGDGVGGASTQIESIPAGTSLTCSLVPNRAATNTDCDDIFATTFPGAPEGTDGIDANCDGVATCFVDFDEDGFGAGTAIDVFPLGAALGARTGCNGATSAFDGDCLDCAQLDGVGGCLDSAAEKADAATVFPGASEVVGNIFDEDCDTEIACHPDEDGDGFGSEISTATDDSTWQMAPNALNGVGSCLAINGHSVNNLDCHDDAGVTSAAAFPGNPAGEIAGNAFDDDCDGVVHCLFDGDGDGVAAALGAATGTFNGTTWTPGIVITSPSTRIQIYSGTDRMPDTPYVCDQTRNEAFISSSGRYDCYDEDDVYGPLIYPTATATPADTDSGFEGTGPGTGIDFDCDDQGVVQCFVDNDGDGFGGTTTDGTDLHTTGFPGHVPGLSPDGSANQLTNPCLDPALLFAPVGGDCDDDDDTVFADANGIEIPGDDLDNDCDNVFDCYQDLDGDGFGTKVVQVPYTSGATITCDSPANGRAPIGGSPDETYNANNYDCHDDNPDAYPGAPSGEIPGNDFDDDCSGNFTCFRDLDEDDYGTEAEVSITVTWRDIDDGLTALSRADVGVVGDSDVWVTFDCDLGAELAAANPDPDNPQFDCHDTNFDANPGIAFDPAGESLGTDGVAGRAWDEDCDGIVQCYRDEDDDGFGTYLVDLTTDETRLDDPAVTSPNPASTATKYITKIGGDFYLCDNNDFNWAGVGGTPGVPADLDRFDCHDDNASIFPRLGGDPLDVEVAGNAYDDNCDGRIDCYEDLDDDGFGTAVVADLAPGSFPLVDAPNFAGRDGRASTVGGYKVYACGDEALTGLGLAAPTSGTVFDDITSDQLAAVGGTSGFDCHDDYALANPGIASETPGVETLPLFGTVAFDENCDGIYDCYTDLDNDSYGTDIRQIDVDFVSSTPSIRSTNDNGVYSCELAPNGLASVGETEFLATAPTLEQGYFTSIGGGGLGSPDYDCHDTNALANPGVTAELPGDSDGVDGLGATLTDLSWDDDCDGYVDCYRDLDDDDYGTYVVTLNVQGLQTSEDETISVIGGTHFDCDEDGRLWAGIGGEPSDPEFDCHDDTNLANPGIVLEDASDAWDNDCDGSVFCYEDLDNDEFGTDEKPVSTTPATGVAAPASFDRYGRSDEDAGLLLFPCGPISAAAAGLDLSDTSDPAVSDLLAVLGSDRRAEKGGITNPTEYDCHDDWTFAFPQFPAGSNEIAGDPFDNDCDGVIDCYVDRDFDGFGNKEDPFQVTIGNAVGHDYDSFPWSEGKGALPTWPVKAFPLIEQYQLPTNLLERSSRALAVTGTWYNCLEVETDSGEVDINNDPVFVLNAAASGGEGSDFYDCHDDEPTVFPGFDDTVDEVVPIRPEIRTEVANQFATCGGPVMCVVETPAGAVEVYDAGAGSCCLNPLARVESPVDDPDTSCPNVDPGRWRCFEPGRGDSDNGEIAGDQFDNDCDGLVMCYQNRDGDGVGTIAQLDIGADQIPTDYDEGIYVCSGTGESEITGDCHDNRPDVQPPQAARANTPPGGDATDLVTLGDAPANSNIVSTGAVIVTGYDDVENCPVGVVLCYDPNNDTVSDRYDTPDCSAIAGDYRCYENEIVGDQFDQDCDGAVACYYDQDQDGFGIDSVREADPTSRQVFANSADGGWYICADDRAPTTAEFDCNDTNPFENPDGVETDDIMLVAAELAATAGDPGARARAFNSVGNDIDENCDGTIMCWSDADNDGYGEGVLDPAQVINLDNPTLFAQTSDLAIDDDWQDGDDLLRWAIVPAPAGRSDCLNPGLDDPELGFTSVSYRIGDCHDDNADANPAADSVPGDEYDNDCNAEWLCFLDADGDGFGTEAGDTVVDDGDEICDDDGEAAADDDCLDDNTLVTGVANYPINADGTLVPTMPLADQPTVAFLTNPNGQEFFGDGIDGDCNGLEKCFVDADLDNFISGAGAGSETDEFGRTGRIIEIGPESSDPVGKINCGDIQRGLPRVIVVGEEPLNLSRWPAQAPFTISVLDNVGLANSFVIDNLDFASEAIFDCDDGDDEVFPQSISAEIFYDGVDQNCDNRSDYDQDGDGYDTIDVARPECPDFEDPAESLTRADIDPVVGCGPGTDYFDEPEVGLVTSTLHRAPYDRARFYDLDGDGIREPNEDIETAALEQICAEDPGFYLCACADDPAACACPENANFEICTDAVSRGLRSLDGSFERPITAEGTPLLVGIPGDPEACESSGPQIDDDADGNPNTRYRCWFNYEEYLKDLPVYAANQRAQQLPWRAPSRELYTFCLPAGRDVDYFIDRSDSLNLDEQRLNDPDDTYLEEQIQRFAEMDGQFGGFEWDPNWQEPVPNGGKYYRDFDGDNEGDANHQGVWLCDRDLEDINWESLGTDCNDNSEIVNARGVEICDGEDNNCDSEIDEPTQGVEPSLTECDWHYLDGDGDSWGLRGADPALSQAWCICPLYEKRVIDPISGEQISQNEPQVCEAFVERGESVEAQYGHQINGSCFVLNDKDCNDLNATIKPVDPGTARIEFIDGIDNDCNDELPIIELDCDDDNAYPYLPNMSADLIEKPLEVAVESAEQVGLEPCCTEEGGVCVSGAPPNLFCWGENMALRCDIETKLWVVNTTTLGERFVNAQRVPRDSDCGSQGKGNWDCDDTCPARCDGLDEVCDGIDNDCNGFEDFVTNNLDIPLDVDLLRTDIDGIPDVMQAELSRIGLVDASELDLDGDQFVSCDETTTPGTNNQRAVTDRSCRNFSLFNDCNDRCALSSPSGEEAICNGFVENSDCATEIAADSDGDNYLSCGTYGTELEAEEKVYALVFTKGSVAEFFNNTEDFENTVVPLIPPRQYAGGRWAGSSVEGQVRECDVPLDNALNTLLGDEALSRDAETARRQLLEICVLADSCRVRIETNLVEGGEESANNNEDAIIERPGSGQSPAPPATGFEPVPDYCDAFVDADSGVVESRCSVVELTLNAQADVDIYDRNIWPGSDTCVFNEDGTLFHPEQAITRTVWSQEQIVEARKLVVDFECYRMFGTMGCEGDSEGTASLTDGTPWVSRYAGELAKTGGFFELPEIPEDFYESDNDWWLHMGRYNPVTIRGGDTIVGCWGDPLAVGGDVDQVETINLVGGDCAQTTEDGVKVNPGDAHRGMAEGPSDLVGWYQGESVACATCLDGIDNNCNSLIDEDDPACTQCFVGQGYGCGCSAGNRSSTVGRTAPAWLLLWALVAVRVRRREHT